MVKSKLQKEVISKLAKSKCNEKEEITDEKSLKMLQFKINPAELFDA
ncbi:MAG: hypothetical protein ACI97N_002670 [Cognaticolwellia sp.]|jgi:hypothetical protein